MTPRVAVSGASGFIGRHVLRAMLDAGVPVVALSRKPETLAGLSDRLDIVEFDVSDPTTDIFNRLGRPDALLHLAWEGLPNYGSLHHFETELPRHYRFLKSLIGDGLKSLVVTGTCFEYGLQSGALSETMEARPATPYGFAKDQLRRQLQFLQQHLEFRLTWARLFYTYGQGQAESSLWSQFQRAVSQKHSTFDMSGGDQLRDFLPVEEVAAHLTRLTLLQNNVGIVNICSGRPISVRKLVENWLEQSGADISLNLGRYPYPSYEPMKFWGNSAKITTLSSAE